MKTYDAIEVTLVEKLVGESSRSVHRTKVKSLRVDPNTKQAVIVFNDGREYLQVYTSVTLVPGELDRMTIIHRCDTCGGVFESSQALGRHKLIHQTEAPVAPQTSNQKRR